MQARSLRRNMPWGEALTNARARAPPAQSALDGRAMLGEEMKNQPLTPAEAVSAVTVAYDRLRGQRPRDPRSTIVALTAEKLGLERTTVVRALAIRERRERAGLLPRLDAGAP